MKPIQLIILPALALCLGGCALGRTFRDEPVIGIKLPDESAVQKAINTAAPFMPFPFNVIVPAAGAVLLGGGGYKLRGKIHDAADGAWDQATSWMHATYAPPPEKTFTPPPQPAPPAALALAA